MTKTEAQIAAAYLAREYGMTADAQVIQATVAEMSAEEIASIVAAVKVQPHLLEAELSFDEAEAHGFDGTLRDGSAPHTWREVLAPVIGREAVMSIFNNAEARTWRAKFGRSEISEEHFPIGWVTLDLTSDLNALVDSGRVRLVNLPHRRNPDRRVTFVVKAERS